MDITSLVKVKTLKIEKETIILNNDAIGKWCQRSYSGHKKGCPNYGKNPLCPPNSFYFNDIIKKYNYFYLIYAEFEFKEYIEKRKEEHPEWSEKQLKNSRYWQNSIKKILKKTILKILYNNCLHELLILGCGAGFNDKRLMKFQEKIYSMESVGINVLSSLRLNGIKAKTHPKDKIYLVCLISSVENLENVIKEKFKIKICPECGRKIVDSGFISWEDPHSGYSRKIVNCICGFRKEGETQVFPKEPYFPVVFKETFLKRKKKKKLSSNQTNTLDKFI
ncbi:MAG: DUF2284 domain-containing protein [Candidatus Hodarchaeota archaeon]